MNEATTPTHYLPIRKVPGDVMAVLNAEAKDQSRSRENLVRIILTDWAKRAMACRQEEGRRD